MEWFSSPMATHEGGDEDGMEDGGKVHEVHGVLFLFAFNVSAEQHVQISKRVSRCFLEQVFVHLILRIRDEDVCTIDVADTQMNQKKLHRCFC
jgi:hypothetical protein